VDRKLGGTLLSNALLFRAEVQAKSPMRFRRHLLCRANIRGDVKERTASFRLDATAFRRWWWVHDRTLRLVSEKRRSGLLAIVVFRIPSLGACGRPLSKIRTLELEVVRGSAEQVVECRRRIVRGH
jgi:hypothetical protein